MRVRFAEKMIEQIMIAAAIGMALWWFLHVRDVPTQLLERRDCENAYRQARTAADTVTVDARIPFERRPARVQTGTCGALRRAGKL